MSVKESGKTPPLHVDHQVNRDLLERAIDWLEQSRIPRAQPVPLDQKLDLPGELPEAGMAAEQVLDFLAPMVLGGAAQLHHPGYFAHMDPPTPVIAWAAALWQSAANQNMLHPDAAPAARQIERRVVDWLAPAFGMSGGHLVPGSTISNLTALWAARELKGIRRVVTSTSAHLSVRKAADLLGLQFVACPCGQDHRIQQERLGDLTDAALVLTAGTVATGAIDSLVNSAAAWVHVDAAWAGPMRLSPQHASRLHGIENADSVGFSAHKWLYQPKGAAFIFFRDTPAAHHVMSYGGGYLSAANIGVIGSAPAAALPLIACLLAWGKTGVAQQINVDMANADRLVARIQEDARFELWNPNGHSSGVVVWRPTAAVGIAENVRANLTNAWVSLVEIDGEYWLRSVAANPGADPDYLFEQVIAAL